MNKINKIQIINNLINKNHNNKEYKMEISFNNKNHLIIQ